MKLTFGRSPAPPPLVFNDDAKPTKGSAWTTWLPDDEFNALARKHGFPITKDGFAIWPTKWWQKPRIYVRASKLTGAMEHEAAHIDQRRNWHKGVPS